MLKDYDPTTMTGNTLHSDATSKFFKHYLKTGLTEPWSDIVFVKEAISLATLASLSISFNLQVSASSFINVLKLFINVSASRDPTSERQFLL
jgi:hypothetical protein